MGASSRYKLTDFSRKNEVLYPADTSLLFLQSKPFHNFKYVVDITRIFSEESKLSDFKSNGYTTYKRSLFTFRFGSGGNFYNFTKSLHCQMRLNEETLRDNVC